MKRAQEKKMFICLSDCLINAICNNDELNLCKEKIKMKGKKKFAKMSSLYFN